MSMDQGGNTFQEARELARLLVKEKESNLAKIRQGVIASVEDGSVSILLSGDQTFPIGGIKFLESYFPRVHDVVWLLQNGPDLLVIGNLRNPETEWQGITGRLLGEAETSGLDFNNTVPTQVTLSNMSLLPNRRYKIQAQITGRVDGGTPYVYGISIDRWRFTPGWETLRTIREWVPAATTYRSTYIDWTEPFDAGDEETTINDFRITSHRQSGTSGVFRCDLARLMLYDVGPI